MSMSQHKSGDAGRAVFRLVARFHTQVFRVQGIPPALSADYCPNSNSRLLHDLLRSFFAVNTAGNAHVVGRVLKQ
jgi:hypothetical protein